jgi:hypothetical protein
MNVNIICYLYENNGLIDFGQTTIKKNLDIESALERIRQQDKQKTAKYRMHWNVTSHAEKIGKTGSKDKIDKIIADGAGLRRFRKSGCDDTYIGISADDAISMIDDFLEKQNLPLPVCGLTELQYDSVSKTIEAKKQGLQFGIADLCARFGKTIYTAACILEMGTKINVVLSYVLTSMTSFKNDIKRFEQFKNMAFVDTSAADYMEQVTKAVDMGKQVVAFVSMCGKKGTESEKNKRLKWLLDQGTEVNLFVDEADFGAWKQNMIRENVNDDTFVVLMTGTNIDRASLGYEIDFQITVSYFDLLLMKKNS